VKNKGIGRRPTPGRRAAALAFLLAVLAIAVACGSDSSGVGPTNTPQSNATPPAGILTDDATEAEIAIARVLDAPYDTVEAADGAAELLVPPSALPDGLEPGALKITQASPDASGLTIEGQPPAVAYNLEPDGAVFETPVVVRLTLPLDPDGAIPTLFLRSGSELTELPVVAEMNTEENEVTVSAPVPHFSTIFASNGNGLAFLLGGLDEPGDQTVSVPFTLGVRVRPEATTWEGHDYSLENFSGGILDSDVNYELLEWSIKGEWKANKGSVEPSLVMNAPPLTKVGSSVFTLQQEFTCKETGPSEITYRGRITAVQKEDFETVVPGIDRERTLYLSFSRRVAFFCLAANPTPTPPPPTPTSIPTPTPKPVDIASILSTFDDGLEGWSGSGGCQAMEHQSGGDADGGYLFVDNDDRTACRLQVPEKFRAARDLSGFYGGTISFDGKMIDAVDPTWDSSKPNGGEGFNYGTVVISGHTGTIKIDFVVVPKEPKPQEAPWTQWQTHSARIVAGNQQFLEGGASAQWTDYGGNAPVTEAQIRSVLKNVTSISINVEAIYGREKQAIDNFSITAAPWNPQALLDTPPVVDWFGANYEAESHRTFYEIRVYDDDKHGLRFDWHLSNICGDFTFESRPRPDDGFSAALPAVSVATWVHPGCAGEPDHPAIITIDITDSDGNELVCRYEGGSASSKPPDARSPAGFDCAD
jgi:hypothetical protein